MVMPISIDMKLKKHMLKLNIKPSQLLNVCEQTGNVIVDHYRIAEHIYPHITNKYCGIPNLIGINNDLCNSCSNDKCICVNITQEVWSMLTNTGSMNLLISPMVETTIFQPTPLQSWAGMLNNLKTIDINSPIDLKLEESNKKDKEAIAIYSNNKKLGYIPAEYQLKHELFTAIKAGQHVSAVLANQLHKDIDAAAGQMQLPIPGIEPLPFKQALRISKAVYLAPNPQKGPYSNNFYGYLTVYGTYKVYDSNVSYDITDTLNRDGIQVTLLKNKSNVIVEQYNGKNPDYAGRGDLPLPINSDFIMTAIATAMNKIGLISKPKNKKSLFTTMAGDLRVAEKNDGTYVFQNATL